MFSPERHSQRLRVVLIEDSPIQSEALWELCEEDPTVTVVGAAGTGTDGIELVLRERPDLVLCDIGLPGVDGFEVITQIMSERPTPIIVVTATLRPRWRRDAFDALALGAIDVVEKPSAAQLADRAWRARFQAQLHLLAGTKVIPHVMGRVRHRFQPRTTEIEAALEPRLVAIVASAGGPRAVQEVLDEMQPAFPLSVPLIVALHVGRSLTAGYGSFLARALGAEVREIQNAETLRPGLIYVAPGGAHTAIDSKARASLVAEVANARHIPSFDHLLTSIAAAFGATAAGAVLTGMGADGAQGLLAMRRAGGLTLAQNKETSTVYGMPRAAADIGAATFQLPPPEIGRALLSWLGTAARGET